MVSPNIEPLLFETYLAVINNAVGSKMFKNGYAKINGVKTDILKDGELSCAMFVSSVLSIFNLIDEPHATVRSVVKKIEEADWIKVEKLEPGCVVIWEEKQQLEWGSHTHIGFYVGNSEAISNNPQGTTPIKHHYTFGVKDDGKPERSITDIYRHPKFMKND